MMAFHFGSMDEYLQATYAPTGRAGCRQCKEKIEKGEIRMGHCIDEDHFSSHKYYHLPCFTLRPLFKDIDPLTQIYKFNDLSIKDQEEVQEYIEAQKERLRKGGKKGKKRAASIAKTTKKESQEEEEQEQYEEVKPARKRKAAKSQPAKRQPSASKPKKKKALKKIAKRKVLTAAQEKLLSEYLNEYMKKSADQLKAILGANSQSRSGNKGQLALKCADGKLLGRIPLCPSCGGGRPRFDKQNGTYKCPGYMEDDIFQNCNKTFDMDQIQRLEWVEP